MAQKKRKARAPAKKQIDSYEHKGKERTNNQPVGVVTPETDIEAGRSATPTTPTSTRSSSGLRSVRCFAAPA